MTNPNEETQKPNIQANDNSVAVGNVSVGGSLGGNLTIGNTYNYETSEDDVTLTSAELEIGLTRFAEYLPERAQGLQEKFASIAKKLRTTLGAELSALSPILKTQHEDKVFI